MAEQPIHHIMLLPRDNYWEWVNAAKAYALKFNVTLTPSPQNAAMFHRPNQIISIINPGIGFSEYGNIVEWFQREAKGAQLDVLKAANEEQGQEILAYRIAQNNRLAAVPYINHSTPLLAAPSPQPKQRPIEISPSPPITLQWPTDFDEIIHRFAANPELYQSFGLPGHEGVDIKAPLNSRVYACADGFVYHTNDGSTGHPYGIHVRIRHPNEFSTIYGHLNATAVHDGQEVRAGDVIGLAGSTGSATRSFLHLGLKRAGATILGLTPFPNDFIDPAPYLVKPTQKHINGHCLLGVYGPNQPMTESDWDTIFNAGIGALKFSTVSRLENIRSALNANLFVLVRLDDNFRNRGVLPIEFVRSVEPFAMRCYEQGVRYFEVHHQPNISAQGFGQSWDSGEAFGKWFSEVVGLLKPNLPDAQFGWPGLAPGSTQGVRADHWQFMQSAGGLVGLADWIGCHCYWESAAEMFDIQRGLSYRPIQDEWYDKRILITEFGNPSLTAQDKARQYAEYYQYLKEQSEIGAVFALS